MAPSKAVEKVLVPGKGELFADSWYDDNKALGIMFKSGYTPIVKPNRNRYHGYWRRKARRIFFKDIIKYRRRGRGESIFGSLTNNYGDKIKTILKETTRTRISARIVNYLVKLFIRVKNLFIRIFRHALRLCNSFIFLIRVSIFRLCS